MANGTAESSLTMRRDAWWVAPLITVAVLGGFGIYATLRAFENNHYLVEPYLSPFYSPLIILDWWGFSPAFLILWAPGGFRATCYYYRKAYYRSFFFSPPGCAVRGVTALEGKYTGETKFPFILQNIHRYFLYASIVIVAFLWIDAYKAFWFDGKFGIGLGSIIITLNALLLSLYSLSCHSLRHLIGGRLDIFSKCPTRYMLWQKATILNENHMLWAWVSLFGVALTDVYIRLLATGTITDMRFI
ncbi:MAG: succinate dehydrogenase [Deltaproteobacteria bacterium]